MIDGCKGTWAWSKREGPCMQGHLTSLPQSLLYSFTRLNPQQQIKVKEVALGDAGSENPGRISRVSSY